MSVSLRFRLFAIILLPLLVISTAVGFWRINEARKTAQDLYDRNLVFTAVAVARDMALLDGDTISPETSVILNEAAGGPVRYHVYAPDGVFVTGYAMPPVPIGAGPKADKPFAYFDATYKGDQVRVLRLWDVSQISGLSGIFTITVWQDKKVRQGFVRSLALRTLTVILALIGTTAIVVWFGVNFGLKPLLDLEEAISRRSPEDLTPIRRKVPEETQGIVQQFNRLIGQLKTTFDAQNDFISDAAHQLQNPIAGIRALAESILTAGTLETAKSRATDLVGATIHASDLAVRLLTLERIRAGSKNDNIDLVDLNELSKPIVQDFQLRAANLRVSLNLSTEDTPVMTMGDPVMLREAITNLLDNALIHGGPALSKLALSITTEDEDAVIQIIDDGIGLEEADIPKVMARFGQVDHKEGSGLGLPIAEAVAHRHGGKLQLLPQKSGLVVRLTLPLSQPQTQRPAA
ncbi:MAG: sensor histidine kinase [Rhizobiaceae bacterium]|nr:sensor histidine kinase [Rhizobiaceae bacterium]MBL4732247.1 sensor histidine kinase [Rhizobiaceae bacterium]